ncbi:MAG: DNA recombination/repair protein RecA, partial [Rhodospirillaceae bacterium]
GSWFSCNSERIGQGRENAKTFLREHPDMAKEIERQIRVNAGLIADTMIGEDTPPAKEDDAEVPAAE